MIYFVCAVGCFTVGGIRAEGDELKETEGMSGLYYLGRVSVNGTLKSISAVGPINNRGDENNVWGRFALFVVRNNTVYQRFRLLENLTTESDLMGNNNCRKIDVKESDDILVFIYNNCASNDGNVTYCPWQVNFPSNTSKSLFYNGSDDNSNIMATPVNNTMFNAEVDELIMNNFTIETNVFINVEVTISGM